MAHLHKKQCKVVAIGIVNRHHLVAEQHLHSPNKQTEDGSLVQRSLALACVAQTLGVGGHDGAHGEAYGVVGRNERRFAVTARVAVEMRGCRCEATGEQKREVAYVLSLQSLVQTLVGTHLLHKFKHRSALPVSLHHHAFHLGIVEVHHRNGVEQSIVEGLGDLLVMIQHHTLHRLWQELFLGIRHFAVDDSRRKRFKKSANQHTQQLVFFCLFHFILFHFSFFSSATQCRRMQIYEYKSVLGSLVMPFNVKGM